MKIYVFVEPHPTGGSATIEITEEQIQTWMTEVYPQIPTEHQVEEFCILHWAWEKNPER